jgi:hypothetical protein
MTPVTWTGPRKNQPVRMQHPDIIKLLTYIRIRILLFPCPNRDLRILQLKKFVDFLIGTLLFM